MSTGKFDLAISYFDEYNKKDPNVIRIDGRDVSASLVYAERMTDRLASFAPDALEELRLAARC